MEIIIMSIIVSASMICSGILTIKYLNGDFSILKIEEVKKSTVDNMDLRINSYELSKKTYVTQRITYQSGKVEYKTVSYIHN